LYPTTGNRVLRNLAPWSFFVGAVLFPTAAESRTILPAAVGAVRVWSGAGSTQMGGLKTLPKSGPLDISIARVFATTCRPTVVREPDVPTRTGWELIFVDWVLRNPGTHLYAFPHTKQPGFRLVLEHRLYQGFFSGYTGYEGSIPPHTSTIIRWTFAIHRGTRRVTLTFVPPGPKTVLWSIAVPRLRPTTGGCAVSR
jgi:hypothetical protein